MWTDGGERNMKVGAMADYDSVAVAVLITGISILALVGRLKRADTQSLTAG